MGERHGSGNAAGLDASPLGRPLKFPFSGKIAPNRFLKASMTERVSSWSPTDLPARGIPSETLINVYRHWGEGGFGTILTGNIMIEYDQLEAAGNPIITRRDRFEGERFEAFRKMAAAGKSGGGLIIGQVSHPGRQISEDIQPHPVSASDVQLEGLIIGMKFAKPKPLSVEGIRDIIDAFAHAAEYLYRAGFDGIELHGAHGYLLSQFLSPSTNHRTDQYGGALESRARIIFEIIEEIQRRLPRTFSIGIKVNSKEFQDKGFDADECRDLCARLEAHGVDFVELSGGTYQNLAFVHKRESTRKREAFFLEFAETIVPALKKTRTFVTGGLRSVEAMLGALETVDGVGLGRPAAQEPNLPKAVLEAGVSGSKKWLLDEDDYGPTGVAAGTLIQMSGRNLQLLDLSNEKDVDIFQNGMKIWAERMQNDQEKKLIGFIEPDDLKTAA